MKTLFPKPNNNKPNIIIINAANKILGRVATQVSKILSGKQSTMFTSSIPVSTYVIIFNANKIMISGKKKENKLYYRNSQRPGSLKIETFKQLNARLPHKILENAIWGMLPKTKVGRLIYKNVYIYSTSDIFSIIQNVSNKAIIKYL